MIDYELKDRFQKMTDRELSEYIRFYGQCRKGELADLCRAVSIRIAELSTRRDTETCGTSN